MEERKQPVYEVKVQGGNTITNSLINFLVVKTPTFGTPADAKPFDTVKMLQDKGISPVNC